MTGALSLVACLPLAASTRVVGSSEQMFADIFDEVTFGISDAESLVRHFMDADQLRLFAVYDSFYPKFQKCSNVSGLEEIKSRTAAVRANYKHNHHRLDALPAAYSAHLLPGQLEFNRNALSVEIDEGLRKNQNREAREIILQNLISVTIPNFDSVRQYPFTHEILHGVETVVKDALQSEDLVSHLTLATQYLMNVRALIRHDPEQRRNLKLVEKILRRIRRCKGSQAREVIGLMDAHAKLFTHPDKFKHNSLPPHYGEILFALNSLDPSWDQYGQLVTIQHARLVHQIWKTASGVEASDFMTTEEALVALAKCIHFWRDMDLYEYISVRNIPYDYPGTNDHEFGTFLQSDFPALLRNAERMGFKVAELSQVRGGLNYAEVGPNFPLTRYKMEHLVNAESAMGSGDSSSTFVDCIKQIGTGAAGGTISTIIGAMIIGRWQRAKQGALDDEEMQRVEKATAKVVTTTEQMIEALEREEADLGSAELPNQAPSG